MGGMHIHDWWWGQPISTLQKRNSSIASKCINHFHIQHPLSERKEGASALKTACFAQTQPKSWGTSGNFAVCSLAQEEDFRGKRESGKRNSIVIFFTDLQYALPRDSLCVAVAHFGIKHSVCIILDISCHLGWQYSPVCKPFNRWAVKWQRNYIINVSS